MVSFVDRLCPFKDRRTRAWATLFAAVSFVVLTTIVIVVIAARDGSGGGGDSSTLAEGGSLDTPSPVIPPSPFPSATPSSPPTATSSSFPTATPSSAEAVSTDPPTPSPSIKIDDPDLPATPVTYQPGNLTTREAGLLLSEGLTARIIAVAGSRVVFDEGGQSSVRFHHRPDYGACFAFPEDHPENPGGWAYLSNSEVEEAGQGGVGSLVFDRTGKMIDYKMLLTGTTMNCAGGRTPWGTFVSCEEISEVGKVYQVDPFGSRPAEVAKGFKTGRLEAFAYDDRNQTHPQFFVTEDQKKGALRRLTPDVVDWDSPWDILHSEGTLEFLVLEPESENSTKGTYIWTRDHKVAKFNAELYYPSSEGLDRSGNILFMTCKKIKMLFFINLDDGTYESFSTEHGAFDGTPDQLKRILADEDHDILYFVEDQGRRAGIHGRNSLGQFFTILEEVSYTLETTGLAFSPDGMFLYFCMQDDGLLFEVTRLDGLPFHGMMLDIRYHNQPDSLS